MASGGVAPEAGILGAHSEGQNSLVGTSGGGAQEAGFLGLASEAAAG